MIRKLNHLEKHESLSGSSGRSRRQRARQHRTSSVDLAGCQTLAGHSQQILGRLGYLSEPLSPEVPGHLDIEPELWMDLRDAERKTAIIQSLQRIEGELDIQHSRAYLEHSPEDDDTTRIVIEVTAEFDEIEQYRQLKSDVRELVRGLESDGGMIYTRIERSS